MAYRPKLAVRVEALEAVWYWQPPDRTLARLAPRAQRVGQMESTNLDSVPDEILELLPDLFLEGVVGWEGVLDEAGQPLECTAENRRLIPTTDKLEVAMGYLVELQRIIQGKG